MNRPIPRAILYYPTIQIRNINWIKQAALYWDVIGTIVPHNLVRDVRDNREFQELEEHGMMRFYYPESYVEESDQLAEEFISTREKQQYKKLSRLYQNSNQKFELYKDKIPNLLARYMLNRNIAEERENGSLRLNKLDGLLYMSLLAKYLADQDHFATTIPGTDYQAYQNLAFLTDDKKEGVSALTFTLEQILPIPEEVVNLQQVLTFKADHPLELLQFRQVIDEFQMELKRITNNWDLQQLLATYSERIRMQVEILGHLLSDANIATTYGTLDTIMSTNRPDLLDELVNVVSNPTPFNIVSRVINGVIKVSGQRIDARNEQRRTLLASSYSYLYLASKRGVISKL